MLVENFSYTSTDRSPVALGFLIWKMMSDLWIIFSICELVLNVRNVLGASATDAVCLQGRYGKIKLLDFSVKFSWILSVIDKRNSSLTSLNPSGMSLTLPRQLIFCGYARTCADVSPDNRDGLYG